MPIRYADPGAVNGLPWGNEKTNAQGSPYLTLSPTALGAISTSDLNRAIFEKIFDTKSSAYFDSLKMNLMTKTPISVSDDVYSWDEQPEQRTGLVIDDGLGTAAGTQLFAAVPLSAGGYVTRTVPVTAATMRSVGLNYVVAFSPTQHAVVTARPTATTLTLTSLVGEGIPAIIQGARLTPMGESIGDSMVGWRNVQRPNRLQRTNYVASFRRALQYGRKELFKLEGNSRNNNLEMDREDIFTQLKYDALVNMWIGRKGTRLLDDGTYAKGMDGIHTQMVQGGATFANTSLANLAPAFETLAQDTNHQSKGGVRNVYARQAMLTVLSKYYKEHQTRYKSSDSMANLDLEAIQVGGAIYRFCPVEPFGNQNFFPDMANNMYVIDDESIAPVVHERLPMFDMGGLMQAKRSQRSDMPQSVQDGTIRRDYSIRDAELNFSMRMVDPKRSFALIAN